MVHPTKRSIAAVVVIEAALVTAMLTGCPSSESPPSAPTSNATSDVSQASYVGSQRCAECHDALAEHYAGTGHAQTFALTQESEPARRLDGKTFHDGEREVTFHYHFDPSEGLSVTLPEQFGEDPFPLTYALGSNQHAQTFVTLIPNRSGGSAGLEHRVSVFGSEGQLDFTPGHRGELAHEEVQMFGKVLEATTIEACVGCHTTTADIRNTQVTNLRPNVQCERCHGPGSQHVAAAEQGFASPGEYRIDALRPSAGSGARRQIQVCGACHRMPKDLVPDDIHPDNSKLARFQPVGLLQSRCFTESGEALACSSCHDPHDRPSHQLGHYVAKCLACHDESNPSQHACPVSPVSGCVECHMPPVEVHPGIRFHDHWIRIPSAAKDKGDENVAEE